MADTAFSLGLPEPVQALRARTRHRTQPGRAAHHPAGVLVVELEGATVVVVAGARWWS
ncbi:MAG: hypothetical protein ACR2KK_15135 [Acidimicrobiales bacterium]